MESQEERKDQAAQAETGKDPQVQQRKRQRKSTGPNLVGWFLEAYPLRKDDSGKTVPSYPPTVFELTKSRNMKQAMEQFRAVAEKTPEKVADCYCRILQVHKDFRTVSKQTIQIV